MSFRGRLLVATPLIEDPNFLRTVVVLLQHDEDGALGIVLNRPSLTPVGTSLPEWRDLATEPGVVFVGGPVATDAVIGLATTGPKQGDPCFDERIAPGFGTVDLHEVPDGESPWARVRLFAGAAGWSPGQLEDELAEGAWWIADRHPDDVVTTDPAGLWSRVVRRQRGDIAWFANCPLDPSCN